MAPPASPKARILVVDDEEPILSVFQQILIPSAQTQRPVASEHSIQKTKVAPVFEIVCCRQGPEASDHVKDSLADGNPFAVVFLDLLMPPGPSGVETARMIRQIDPDIEIVLVTGKLDVNPVEIAQEIPPEYKLLYLRKPFFKRILKTGKPTRIADYEVIDKDGSKKTLELSIGPLIDRKGSTTGFRGLARDVTQRVHNKNTLRESEERYRNFFAATQEGICFHDSGAIIDINDRFIQLFGFGQSTIIGSNLAELIINQKDKDWVARKIATEEREPFRVIAHRKDDSTFLAEIQSRPATLLGRKLQAAAIRDISNH
jgi:PAS domain S-box-containing protein